MIAQALDWIRSNSDLDENGKVKIIVDIPYYASKELLTSLTLGETNLPERTHRRAVNLAVNRWRKYKKYQRQEDSPSIGHLDLLRQTVFNCINPSALICTVRSPPLVATGKPESL